MISELHRVAGKNDEEGRSDKGRLTVVHMRREDQGSYRLAAVRHSLSAAWRSKKLGPATQAPPTKSALRRVVRGQPSDPALANCQRDWRDNPSFCPTTQLKSPIQRTHQAKLVSDLKVSRDPDDSSREARPVLNDAPFRLRPFLQTLAQALAFAFRVTRASQPALSPADVVI